MQEKKLYVSLISVFHYHWEGSHYKKSPRVKELDVPDLFVFL